MKNVERRKTRRRKYEKADRTGALGIDEGSGGGGISLRQVEQEPDKKRLQLCRIGGSKVHSHIRKYRALALYFVRTDH